MASTSIRSTYSLDAETLRALEDMARRWKVSKSEALRRAIRMAAAKSELGTRSALHALDLMQEILELDEEASRRWERENRAERRATS